MNWAKGRATKGRGTSFKGALRYVLHDKDAGTAERVGFVEMRNLATDDPHQARHEMMTCCEAADDLKRRAGEKATGRKLKKPVYAFTLNWHEDDRPTPEHMRETANEALKALGMEHQQAVIAEHTDRPHRHVVHPDTGKAASLSNDEHKLDRWADRYEVAQGVIRSPARRAKFAALEQDRTPPKRPPQAKSREEWEATRGSKGRQAMERAAAIRKVLANRIADVKGLHAAAQSLRRAEADRLWKGYKADRKAIPYRYQPFIDAIYKSRRKAPPHLQTEQAARDLQDSMEWKELGRTQFRQRQAFSACERHLLGVTANAVRLHYARQRKGGIGALFMLAVSGAHRRRAFEAAQKQDKQALRDTQHQRRKARADTLRAACRHDTLRHVMAACRHDMSQRAMEFGRHRQATVARHAGEIAAQRAEWKAIAAERDTAGSEFRREFGDLGQDKAERSSAMRASFNGASSGKPLETGRATDGGGRGGDGKGDSGGIGVAPKADEKRRGWRERRPAGERKRDGNDRPRTRNGRDTGRTRRPTR